MWNVISSCFQDLLSGQRATAVASRLDIPAPSCFIPSRCILGTLPCTSLAALRSCGSRLNLIPLCRGLATTGISARKLDGCSSDARGRMGAWLQLIGRWHWVKAGILRLGDQMLTVLDAGSHTKCRKITARRGPGRSLCTPHTDVHRYGRGRQAGVCVSGEEGAEQHNVLNSAARKQSFL